MKYLLIMLLTVSIECWGGDNWLDIHLTSIHTQQTYKVIGNSTTPLIDKEMNKNNFGLGLSLPINRWFNIRTGFYNNSFNKTSVYLGINPYININRFVSLGVSVGGVTGYNNTPLQADTVSLTIIPQLAFVYNNVRAEFGIFPGKFIGYESALTFTIGIKF